MSKAKATNKKPGSLRGSADGRRTTAMRSEAEIAAFGRRLSDSRLTSDKIAEAIRELESIKRNYRCWGYPKEASRIAVAIAGLKLIAAVQSAAK